MSLSSGFCYSAVGNSGGIARDLMIGGSARGHERPALQRRLDSCRVIAFYWCRMINRLSRPVLVFDAAGLGLFASLGASKALACSREPCRCDSPRNADGNARGCGTCSGKKIPTVNQQLLCLHSRRILDCNAWLLFARGSNLPVLKTSIKGVEQHDVGFRDCIIVL